MLVVYIPSQNKITALTVEQLRELKGLYVMPFSRYYIKQ